MFYRPFPRCASPPARAAAGVAAQESPRASFSLPETRRSQTARLRRGDKFRDALERAEEAGRGQFRRRYQKSGRGLYDEPTTGGRRGSRGLDIDRRRALFSSLTLSIDAMLASKSALLHALAVLDRRFDKRRLETFEPRREAEATRRLFALRCAAEGLPRYAEEFLLVGGEGTRRDGESRDADQEGA